MPTFELHAPESLREASDILARYSGDARPIAGGTAVVLMLRQGLIQPAALVRLDRVAGLRNVVRDGGVLRIGAGLSLSGVSTSSVVRYSLPALAQTCGLVGNVRVRNAATIGGNICEADYASDPPGFLVALDARVRAVSRLGERELPVAEVIRDFYETSLAPDELVAEVIVPVPPPDTRIVHLKYITRSSEDRPCVGTTAVVRLDDRGRLADVRVSVGGVAGRPLRLPEAELMSRGEEPTEDLFRALGERYAAAADPVSDVRASAAYRKKMIAVFVRRALQEAVAGGNGARKC